MKQISTGQLADLTGRTWRTVKTRLEGLGVPSVGRRGNATLYDSQAALEAIYAVERVEPGQLDLEQERARLAAAQAEKVETDNAIRRGQIADVAKVERTWQDLIGNARARMLRAPRDAAAVCPPEVRAVVEAVVREVIHEALRELAGETTAS